MKLLKKLLIILLISIIVIFSLIPPKVVKADTRGVTVEEVGNAIADVAEDFYERFRYMTIYDYGKDYEYDGIVRKDGWTREEAYKNRVTSGKAFNTKGEEIDDDGNNDGYKDKYAMDCVGFVSMIIHRATSLGDTYNRTT